MPQSSSLRVQKIPAGPAPTMITSYDLLRLFGMLPTSMAMGATRIRTIINLRFDASLTAFLPAVKLCPQRCAGLTLVRAPGLPFFILLRNRRRVHDIIHFGVLVGWAPRFVKFRSGTQALA